MNLEMINCIKCKELMPKLRLDKFGYNSCVKCSTIGAYKVLLMEKVTILGMIFIL